MPSTTPLSAPEIAQKVNTTITAVATDFDAQYSSETQISALHTYLTTTKTHNLTLSETRRFLTVLRRYILRQARFTEEYLLKEKGVSGLDVKGIGAEEVRSVALKPEVLRVMVLGEFGAEGKMVRRAAELERDVALWGSEGGGGAAAGGSG